MLLLHTTVVKLSKSIPNHLYTYVYHIFSIQYVVTHLNVNSQLLLLLWLAVPLFALQSKSAFRRVKNRPRAVALKLHAHTPRERTHNCGRTSRRSFCMLSSFGWILKNTLSQWLVIVICNQTEYFMSWNWKFWLSKKVITFLIWFNLLEFLTKFLKIVVFEKCCFAIKISVILRN